jgi:hypothetical protein
MNEEQAQRDSCRTENGKAELGPERPCPAAKIKARLENWQAEALPGCEDQSGKNNQQWNPRAHHRAGVQKSLGARAKKFDEGSGGKSIQTGGLACGA